VSIDQTILALGVCVVTAPCMLVFMLGLARLLSFRMSESLICHATQVAVITGLIATVVILAIMLLRDVRYVAINLGDWVIIASEHFHFKVKFVFDRLSVPFVILSFALCGTIGAFARNYMHRDPGFERFFVFYSFFLLGMIVTSLAGTIETLFVGWELVGLSSAFLVAFFHDRTNPVRNGLRVWVVYRVADAALLIAAVTLHHQMGEGDFTGLMGVGSWPDGSVSMPGGKALIVGLLVLIAAAGKSAQIPFSTWLPRAMEGPTPSSAVFYGALSVHLGAYLLLRVSPIIEASLVLQAAVVTMGLTTAAFAAIAGRVQTDIKSALSFASLTQVGIIIAEIGLGFRYIALIHIIGHACLRTLQLVRAPSLLRDYTQLENAIGDHLSHAEPRSQAMLPARWNHRLYRFAYERGFLDALLDTYIIDPFFTILRACDAAERRWTDLLAGSHSRESDEVEHPLSSNLEDLQ